MITRYALPQNSTRLLVVLATAYTSFCNHNGCLLLRGLYGEAGRFDIVKLPKFIQNGFVFTGNSSIPAINSVRLLAKSNVFLIKGGYFQPIL